jgi:hypothetical protein
VVALRKGVEKFEVVDELVVDRAVPPVELAYHRNVPLTPPEEALRLTVPGLQDAPFVPVIVAAEETVAVTATRGDVGPHAGLEVVKST